MPYALRVNFEYFGHTTKNKIFRLVKLLADLSTMLNNIKVEVVFITEIGILFEKQNTEYQTRGYESILFLHGI